MSPCLRKAAYHLCIFAVEVEGGFGDAGPSRDEPVVPGFESGIVIFSELDVDGLGHGEVAVHAVGPDIFAGCF